MLQQESSYKFSKEIQYVCRLWGWFSEEISLRVFLYKAQGEKKVSLLVDCV